MCRNKKEEALVPQVAKSVTIPGQSSGFSAVARTAGAAVVRLGLFAFLRLAKELDAGLFLDTVVEEMQDVCDRS